MNRPTSTVALPRWVLGLLVGACAVCLIAVAFLLGRVTAKVASGTPAGAAEAGPTLPGTGSAGAGATEKLPTPAAATGNAALPSGPPVPGAGLAAGLRPAAGAPSGVDPDRAAVAEYFVRMDAVAAQVKAAQDPQALAQTILDQTLSGNTAGFDELVAAQRALQARMAEVVPPSSCREHHQRSLQLVGRAIALLERTRDAVAGKGSSDLAGVAAEGHAIEEEARATDALANELRRAAGLPVVP